METFPSFLLKTADEVRQALEQARPYLSEPDAFLTLDTEFYRVNTYWPILCLVQIGLPDRTLIIDPLAPGFGLLEEVLKDIVEDENIPKVMMAPSEDIEIFRNLKLNPRGIYDLQLACSFLNQDPPPGYGALVAQELGIMLDKGEQFQDWRRRPLRSEQLSYAANDVTYLRLLFPRIRERLGHKELWLQEDLRAKERVIGYEGVQRFFLKALPHMAKNKRRRFWVGLVVREVLGRALDIPAGKMWPQARVKELSSREVLMDLIDQVKAMDLRKDLRPFPSMPSIPPPLPEQILKAFKAKIKARAEEEGIPPWVLLPSADHILALLHPEGIEGWRKEIVTPLLEEVTKEFGEK